MTVFRRSVERMYCNPRHVMTIASSVEWGARRPRDLDYSDRHFRNRILPTSSIIGRRPSWSRHACLVRSPAAFFLLIHPSSADPPSGNELNYAHCKQAHAVTGSRARCCCCCCCRGPQFSSLSASVRERRRRQFSLNSLAASSPSRPPHNNLRCQDRPPPRGSHGPHVLNCEQWQNIGEGTGRGPRLAR
jgi:hypothetical protein